MLHFWHCLSCLVSRCLVKNQKYGYLSCTLLWVKLSKPLLDFFFLYIYFFYQNSMCGVFCFVFFPEDFFRRRQLSSFTSIVTLHTVTLHCIL